MARRRSGGFPAAPTIDAFRELSRGDERIAAAAGALCRELGLGAARLFESGSLPVFAAGDHHVLKLFPPCYGHERGHEESVLSRLAGRLPIATPRVVASGDVDGWQYIAMERVPGTSLDEIWGSLSMAERLRLAGELGGLLRALHEVDLGDASASCAEWLRFLAGQKAGCEDAQRRRGLASRWLEQVAPFLARVDLRPEVRPVLLHTEVMRAHVFAARRPQGWSLSGIIDFEPAMVGAAEYEFASVGVFLTCGSGPLLRELLFAYGYREGDLDARLQRRFLAYTLLHRYSNLTWYLELMPPDQSITTLDALAARWWAVADEEGLR